MIRFRTSIEKRNFLEEYQNKTDFCIDYYVYSECEIYNIIDTNMIKCYALRNYNDAYILQKIFSEKIPF